MKGDLHLGPLTAHRLRDGSVRLVCVCGGMRHVQRWRVSQKLPVEVASMRAIHVQCKEQ